MKRKGILLLLLLLILTSCGKKETQIQQEPVKTPEVTAPQPVTPEKPVEKPPQKEESKPQEDLTQLGQNILKAQSEISSMRTQGTLEMLSGLEGSQMALIQEIDTIYVKDPAFIHAMMKSKPAEGSSAIFTGSDMEFYLFDQQVWIRNPALGPSWMRLPLTQESYEEYQRSSNALVPASLYGQDLKEFKVEREGEDYLLVLNADEDQWAELVEALAEDPELSKNKDTIKVKHLELEMRIDAKTYYPKEYRIDMDLIFKEEDKEVTFKQKGHFIYKDINVYKDMKVPQEVLDATVN